MNIPVLVLLGFAAWTVNSGPPSSDRLKLPVVFSAKAEFSGYSSFKPVIARLHLAPPRRVSPAGRS